MADIDYRAEGAVILTGNGQGSTVDGNGQGGTFVIIESDPPVLQSKTVSYTPSEGSTVDHLVPGEGYDGLSEVNVTVNGIPNTYVGSGITRRTSSSLTASGATVTAPAGYYENAASKAVASGTAGTPTATKGAVSNHAVSITPSVTNTTGYITGGTKTGTAVSVSASELVSGSETKTANGTYDVTNLAELVVNVQSGGSSKNFQIADGVNRVSTTAYSAVSGQSLTVAKTGTYHVYWSGYRSSTSGTNGSQLYINNSAYGTAQTTFSNHGQSVHLSNVSLTQGQTIAVYARARGTSYFMYVANLTIIEA